MNNPPSKASLFGFFVWSCITFATLMLGIFTVNGMSLGEHGLSSYASLLIIPNIILLVPTTVVSLALWFKRPKAGEIPVKIWIRTAVVYAIVLVVLFLNPKLWGAYTLRLQIVDLNHKPISGMAIKTLAQKASWFSVFLPEDVNITATTDKSGVALVKTNRFQSIQGVINSPADQGAENKKYRCTGFIIYPVANGKAVVGINWDKAGNRSGSNMNQYTSAPFDPCETPIIVFLPEVIGDDHFDYDREAIGKSH